MTETPLTRRQALATGTGIALSTLVGSSLPTTAKNESRLVLKKALKFSMIQAEGVESITDKMALAKEAGFDGVEFDNTPLDRAQIDEIKKAKADLGLEIPGLVCGSIGRKCGSLDETERKEAVGQFAQALRDSAELGGTTVLMYPGTVDAGRPYEKVYATLQQSIRELLPIAEDTGVRIACENVWNNIFVSPIETRDFIDGFESPWVGWFFDIGNVVRYGWPEQWIRILGPRVLKLDIKEFDRDIMMNEGLRKGFTNELGQGSVDWKAVMDAVNEIGYTGQWGSAEVRGGDLERLKAIKSAMDAVLA